MGGRDCSHLAGAMGWQLDAVRYALAAAGGEFADVLIEPVLCFIDAEWPLFFAPQSFGGVHLEGKRSIKKLVVKNDRLDADTILRIARVLAAQLPAK